jgi:hypothetical protein
VNRWKESEADKFEFSWGNIKDTRKRKIGINKIASINRVFQSNIEDSKKKNIR